jgi:hypothetical protein
MLFSFCWLLVYSAGTPGYILQFSKRHAKFSATGIRVVNQ